MRLTSFAMSLTCLSSHPSSSEYGNIYQECKKSDKYKTQNEVGNTAFLGLRSYLRSQGLFQVEKGNLYWVLRGLLHEQFDCTIQIDMKSCQIIMPFPKTNL